MILDSTGHGYPNILRTDKLVVKIVWSVLFLSSLAFCFYLVVEGFIDFMEYGVTSKIRIENQSPLTYPAITVCNSKPFMTRFAYDTRLSDF